jgi:hypothetical protein
MACIGRKSGIAHYARAFDAGKQIWQVGVLSRAESTQERSMAMNHLKFSPARQQTETAMPGKWLAVATYPRRYFNVCKSRNKQADRVNALRSYAAFDFPG